MYKRQDSFSNDSIIHAPSPSFGNDSFSNDSIIHAPSPSFGNDSFSNDSIIHAPSPSFGHAPSPFNNVRNKSSAANEPTFAPSVTWTPSSEPSTVLHGGDTVIPAIFFVLFSVCLLLLLTFRKEIKKISQRKGEYHSIEETSPFTEMVPLEKNAQHDDEGIEGAGKKEETLDEIFEKHVDDFI